MPAAYCTADDLTEVVLQAYLTKAEELAEGIQAKAVAAANSMVEDALRPVYVLPLPSVPDTLRQIAATLAAHKIVGAVTSLLNETEFKFLLDQVQQARKALARIRDGEDDLGFERLGAVEVNDAKVSVIAPARIFDRKTWERF
ncbi:MAG: hypothetical protein PWQ57_906 [Desulfovibrionales bacterium]|jgi:phage gp36-like protein|nr:hypothetical protein [Desulfovibrionales bacterium]